MKELVHTDNMVFKKCNLSKPYKNDSKPEQSKERQEKSPRDKRIK